MKNRLQSGIGGLAWGSVIGFGFGILGVLLMIVVALVADGELPAQEDFGYVIFGFPFAVLYGAIIGFIIGFILNRKGKTNIPPQL